MNERDKQAVADVMRQRRRQEGGETTRSEQYGEQAAQVGTAQLSELSDKLSDNIVNLVWADAVQKAIVRLGNGDMGELAPQILDSFAQGLNTNFQVEIKALQEWHESPKIALPPGQESDG